MSEAEKAENRKRAAEWYRNNKERANAASRAAHKKRKQAARDAGTTWYQLNKSAMKEQYRTKYATVEGRAGFIWRAAKSRARKHSVPFTLTKERVVELMLAGKCAISGIPFDYSKTPTLRNPFSPSIDRIVPSEGYTNKNVRAICTMGNFARSNWGDEALSRFCCGVHETWKEAKG